VSSPPALPGVESTPVRILLLLTVPAALLIGVYGRFKGIGTWPLGVDEFYLSRSVDHILHSGLPRFPCGGFYTRGLLFQYLVAAVRMTGFSPEFSGRFVAGMCSIAVLPAAYLIGRRANGPLAGWLTVIVLCLSIWEIEMARFGRMYAPFQLVFAYYLLFYLRYTVDRDMGALRWMIGLSFVGVLTWEGGTLLGAANLFAVIQSQSKGRLRAADGWRLAVLTVALVLLLIAAQDWRGAAGSALPGPATGPAPPSLWLSLMSDWSIPRPRHVWMAALALVLGLAGASLRFIASFRDRWMVAAGLSVALLAALGHAFTAAAGVLVMMVLIDLIDWRELTQPRARLFVLALAALLVFWVAYELASGGRPLRALSDFPDVFERVGRPWGRAVPVTAVCIALCGGFLFFRALRAPDSMSRSIRPLVSLALLMVLAVGAIPTNRIETRYTFFLYPLLIVLAVSAVMMAVEWFAPRRRTPALLVAAAPLLCFAFTEDLQLRQVAHVDSVETNFRLGMPPGRADHYFPRNDMRGIAQWLAANIRPGDVVVTGIPSLDQYYPRFNYFYLDEEDNRYDAYVCPDGRTDRWTNHPVVFASNELKPALMRGHPVYAAVYSDVETRLRRDAGLQGWPVTRVYTALDGKTDIVRIDGGAQAPRVD
jgi:hypothetical protein